MANALFELIVVKVLRQLLRPVSSQHNKELCVTSVQDQGIAGF